MEDNSLEVLRIVFNDDEAREDMQRTITAEIDEQLIERLKENEKNIKRNKSTSNSGHTPKHWWLC
jgi:hypothetical protein